MQKRARRSFDLFQETPRAAFLGVLCLAESPGAAGKQRREGMGLGWDSAPQR